MKCLCRTKSFQFVEQRHQIMRRLVPFDKYLVDDNSTLCVWTCECTVNGCAICALVHLSHYHVIQGNRNWFSPFRNVTHTLHRERDKQSLWIWWYIDMDSQANCQSNRNVIGSFYVGSSKRTSSLTWQIDWLTHSRTHWKCTIKVQRHRSLRRNSREFG